MLAKDSSINKYLYFGYLPYVADKSNGAIRVHQITIG